MPRLSPTLDELSRILEDPLERAPLVLASRLEDAGRGRCSLDSIPGEGAWLAKLEWPQGWVEVLVVSGVVVAAQGSEGRGRAALRSLPGEGECRFELLRVDLGGLPYRDKLLEAAGAGSPPGVWLGGELYGYRVEAVVGEGAFSYVLRAQGDWGPVALKVLKPEAAGDRGKVGKFRLEALAQAALSGVGDGLLERVGRVNRGVDTAILEAGTRSVVEVYGIHMPPNGREDYVSHPPTVVMELMERDASSSRPEEAKSIAASAGYALALAHSLGYGHFDLKPGNILYRSGRYKVTDFSGYIRTGRGFIVENITPSYADPLLVARQGLEAGLDSDVYNYYTLLVRLAGGRPPMCTLILNSFLLALHTGSRPQIPPPPSYASRLLDALSRTYTRGPSPEGLLEEAQGVYDECVGVEVRVVGTRLGREWVEYAYRALSLDPGERPGSMASERAAPWESIYPSRG